MLKVFRMNPISGVHLYIFIKLGYTDLPIYWALINT